MKNYTITVNGNVYDVTVEEGTGSTAGAAKAATPKAAAPKAAPKAAAPAGAQGAVKVNAPMPGKILKVNAAAGADFLEGTEYALDDTGVAVRIPYAPYTA